MKDKILAFLKTKMNKEIIQYGVQDSFLSGVAETWSKTIKEEKDIEASLTDGIIDTLKYTASQLQTEGDRRVNQAKLDLKAWREKHGLDENGKPIETPDPKKKEVKTPDPDEPAWFKTYRESKDAELAELKTKLESQEKEKTKSALIEKFTSHEKIKSIPASFLKGRSIDIQSEDQIDQLVAATEADFNAFRQEMADKGVHISVPPAGGGAPKDGEAIGKNIAEKRNANSSDGVKGKEV
jgi:hypothetical protein